MMNRLGQERGWPPLDRAQFEAATGLHGHLVVGSPEQVIEKILFQQKALGHDRFLMQTSLGAVSHAAVMRSIELFGTKVAPAVRAALSIVMRADGTPISFTPSSVNVAHAACCTSDLQDRSPAPRRNGRCRDRRLLGRLPLVAGLPLPADARCITA